MKALRTPYGNIKVYHPHADPKRKTVIVVPGFSETTVHNKKLVAALQELGFNALTFNQPRRRGTDLEDPLERLGDVVLYVARSSQLDQHTKLHVVAHSLGCAAALKAAQKAPERFASITLMQPLGMVGNQSLAEQIRRVSNKVTKNQLLALKSQKSDQITHHVTAAADVESALKFSLRVAKAQLIAAGLLAKNIKLALHEARAAGKYRITADIKRVAALGIPVHVVTAQGDEMFDPRLVAAGYTEIAQHLRSYTTIANQAARHDTFWLQPTRTACIVKHCISA